MLTLYDAARCPYCARVRIALAPLAASYVHLLVQIHIVTKPRTTFEWGALCTGAAFALLFASLAVD